MWLMYKYNVIVDRCVDRCDWCAMWLWTDVWTDVTDVHVIVDRPKLEAWQYKIIAIYFQLSSNE